MKDNTQLADDERKAFPTRLRKILAPTDFSDCADQAFAYALDLARRYGAEVMLFHAVTSLEKGGYPYPSEALVGQETPEMLVSDLLQTVIDQHSLLQTVIDQHNTDGVSVESVSRRGSAVVLALLQEAKKLGADLIVMGTHGRQGVKRFIMGSVAERTVQQAPCSVLTVCGQETSSRKAETPGKLQVQRILVPLDFSDHSEALLRAAHTLALAYGAQLDLLHVIEQPLFVGMFTGVMTANDLVPDIARRAENELHHLWKRVDRGDVQAKLHVEEGHAAAHIVDFAARFGTDLIVIASEGRSGIEHFLIGSVAERVVRAASCPVLTFKPARAEGDGLQNALVEKELAMPLSEDRGQANAGV